MAVSVTPTAAIVPLHRRRANRRRRLDPGAARDSPADPKTTLRVRVIAPIEGRVMRVAARDGLSDDGPRAKIVRIDGERAAYNRQPYGADIAEPAHYGG